MGSVSGSLCRLLILSAAANGWKRGCSKDSLQPICINRGLSEFPDWFNHNVSQITVSDNNIYTLEKVNLGQYAHLGCLKLDGNNLDTPHDIESVGQAPYLIFLDLSRNHIRVLTFKTFRRNVNLQALIVDDNPNMEIAEESARLPYLKTLSLQGNGLLTISIKSLAGFTNLQILDLRRNSIIHLPDNISKRFHNLKSPRIDRSHLLKEAKVLSNSTIAINKSAIIEENGQKRNSSEYQKVTEEGEKHNVQHDKVHVPMLGDTNAKTQEVPIKTVSVTSYAAKRDPPFVIGLVTLVVSITGINIRRLLL